MRLWPSAVVARMRAAPPTTWLLVSTSPSGDTITPEPVPPWRAFFCIDPPALTSSRTTAGLTASTTSITARE